MSDDVKITQHDVLHRGFTRLERYRLKHKLYGGGWSAEIEREVFERGRTVGVLLYDPQRDEVVLVEQFRLPAHLARLPGWELEIVAGIVDHEGESETELCKRETLEEAGLTIIGEPEFMHRFMPSPGACTEICDLYCARVDSSKAGGIHGLADEHEDIKVVVLSYAEAIGLARADKVKNGITVLALYWLALERERLRRAWR
ncbi:MAG TPA: NUDIX domain-containing protein [Stellaceae bacterium]|nr:NUDIX domain-containing protein [Stellaceae bacterium]